MKKYIFMLIIAISTSTGFALERFKIVSLNSNFSTKTRTQWKKLFSGAPVFPTKENLSKMLSYPQSCQSKVEKVMEATYKYGEHMVMGKNTAAILVSKKVLAALKKLENKNDPCFTAVANGYLAASLFLLNANSSLPSTNNTPLVDYRLAIVGTAIINRGFVYPLKLKDRANWSGEWAARSIGQKYHKILGAYDCNQTKIFIDPYLSPIDLGAAFTHELDHLFRDKMITRDIYLNNPRLYTLFDEALSITQSAALEYALDVNSPGFAELNPIREMFTFHFNSYENSQDRTFYDKSGPWSFFWKNTRFSKSDLFPWSGLGLVDPKTIDKYERTNIEYVDYVYSKISSAYFKSGLDSNTTQWLSPMNHSTEVLALSQTLKQMGLKNGFIPNNADSSESEWRFEFIDRTRILQDRSETGSIEMTKSLDVLESLFDTKLTSQISPMCQSFNIAIDQGLLSDYAGKELTVRPGQDGVRPGQDGVRPGQDGVRPGQDGVRPSKSVRPCLNIYKLF